MTKRQMPRIAPLAQNEPGTDSAPADAVVQGEAAEAAVVEVEGGKPSLAEEIVAGGQGAVMRMIASEPAVVARNVITLAKEVLALQERLDDGAIAKEPTDVGAEA